MFRAYDYPVTFRSMEYFFEDAEGLKCYGYRNPGPVVYARRMVLQSEICSLSEVSPEPWG
jgi:hypothetical protein